IYSIGGWITKPGSCNNGFNSCPSAAAGNKRSNGFEVSSMNNMKPTAINPITPNTRATISSGRCLLNVATAAVQIDRMNTHNNKEPSWPPQIAAKRYCRGNPELECSATYSTEKSLWRKALARVANASAINTNCPNANGRAMLINTELLRAAPSIGNTPKVIAKKSAMIKEK